MRKFVINPVKSDSIAGSKKNAPDAIIVQE